MKLKHEIILFIGGCLLGGLLTAAFAVGWTAIRLTEVHR